MRLLRLPIIGGYRFHDEELVGVDFAIGFVGTAVILAALLVGVVPLTGVEFEEHDVGADRGAIAVDLAIVADGFPFGEHGLLVFAHEVEPGADHLVVLVFEAGANGPGFVFDEGAGAGWGVDFEHGVSSMGYGCELGTGKMGQNALAEQLKSGGAAIRAMGHAKFNAGQRGFGRDALDTGDDIVRRAE